MRKLSSPKRKMPISSSFNLLLFVNQNNIKKNISKRGNLAVVDFKLSIKQKRERGISISFPKKTWSYFQMFKKRRKNKLFTTTIFSQRTNLKEESSELLLPTELHIFQWEWPSSKFMCDVFKWGQTGGHKSRIYSNIYYSPKLNHNFLHSCYNTSSWLLPIAHVWLKRSVILASIINVRFFSV